MGVKGWVRNEKDGSVLIWAEGENQVLDQFTEWVRLGSAHSRVDKATTEAVADAGHTDFVITFG